MWSTITSSHLCKREYLAPCTTYQPRLWNIGPDINIMAADDPVSGLSLTLADARNLNAICTMIRRYVTS